MHAQPSILPGAPRAKWRVVHSLIVRSQSSDAFIQWWMAPEEFLDTRSQTSRNSKGCKLTREILWFPAALQCL